MIYAMISNNKVIDIKQSETTPKYPPTSDGKEVISVECDESVEIGMVYDSETGEFLFPEPEKIPEPQPTQLDNIEEGQLIIMEAMADQYEQSVETELTNMEVMATIYEQLLAMEGVE